MSVEYVKGNALDFPCGSTVLLHGCNTLNTFGAGIAAQIKEEYPAAFEADTEATAKGANRLGWFSTAEVAAGKRVINAYIQDAVGTDRRYVDYEALYTVLGEVKAVLEGAHAQGRTYKLCMPYVGCGLAGGSIRVFKAMVEDLFIDSPIKVVVVEYAKSA